MTAQTRDRVAMGLMLIAALGALVSLIGSVGALATAGPDGVVVEGWHAYGFVVFAGLFALLALRPRLYPGVWELAIFHKAAMALTGASLLGSGATDAPTVALADGALALILVVPYVLARGYSAWTDVFLRERKSGRG